MIKTREEEEEEEEVVMILIFFMAFLSLRCFCRVTNTPFAHFRTTGASAGAPRRRHARDFRVIVSCYCTSLYCLVVVQ